MKTETDKPGPHSGVVEQPLPPKGEAPKAHLSTIIIVYDHDTRTLSTKVTAKDRLTVDGMLAGAARELDEKELLGKLIAGMAEAKPKIVAPDSPEGLAAKHLAKTSGGPC